MAGFLAPLLFFVLAAVVLGGVAAMILSRDQAHGALFLVLSFAALGGVFGLFDAPFVAAVQVIVYAGAIMVLFLFVIMTIDPREGVAPEKAPRVFALAGVLGAALVALIVLAIRSPRAASALPAAAGPRPDAAALGELLVRKYLYPFEITSLLIVGALAGALVLLRKDPEP